MIIKQVREEMGQHPPGKKIENEKKATKILFGPTIGILTRPALSNSSTLSGCGCLASDVGGMTDTAHWTTIPRRAGLGSSARIKIVSENPTAQQKESSSNENQEKG